MIKGNLWTVSGFKLCWWLAQIYFCFYGAISLVVAVRHARIVESSYIPYMGQAAKAVTVIVAFTQLSLTSECPHLSSSTLLVWKGFVLYVSCDQPQAKLPLIIKSGVIFLDLTSKRSGEQNLPLCKIRGLLMVPDGSAGKPQTHQTSVTGCSG